MTAYYDPETDTIHGAEPGTYAWHHENRHRQQYSGDTLDREARRTVLAFHLSTFCIIACSMYGYVRFGWPGAGIGLIAGIGAGYAGIYATTLWMEIDAHVYAIRKRLRE